MFVSQASKRGVIILIFILLFIVLIPRIISNLWVNDVQISQQNIDISEKLLIKKSENQNNKNNYRQKYKVPPRSFKPQEYSIEDWKYLGLSKKQAEIVVKFSKNGIRNYEHLKKIFVIPAPLFDLIKDSVIYTQSETNFNSFKTEKKEKLIEKIDVNKASLEQLIDLPFIAEKTGAKIIQYRDRLGGFVAKEQILEIRGVYVDLYQKFEKYLDVDLSAVSPIKLNTCTVDEIRNHPYFNWNIANSIVKIREQNGKFNSIDDIKKSKLIDLELFEKLKPYLSL